MLERRGVISGYEGSKPRQVLITEADLPRVLAALESPSAQPAAGQRPSASAGDVAFLTDMPEIGATLREARMRARIDVSEIEAQTKIRAKYLRALENEEWEPAARARRSSRASCAPTPRRWGSTARRSSRNTACTTSARARRRSSRSSPPRSSSPRARRACPARDRRAATWRVVGVVVRGDRAADRRPADPGWRQRGRTPTSSTTSARHQARHTRHARRRRTPRSHHATARASTLVALSLRPTAAGVRLPDRRPRAQGDPGHRTAAGNDARRPTTPSASRSRSATAR